MTELKITRPEEIGPIEKVTEIIELPFPQNGRKPVLRIRALSSADLLEVQAQEGQRAIQLVAERTVLEPPLCFGAAREPGKLWWNDLLPGNQEALIRAINRISGIGQSPDQEAANRTATFPRARARRSDGAAPDPAVPAAAGTA